eukprot:scaffold1189_cov122-Skeletonema_dohrnii-CCMP3373.AAC.6
MTSIKQQQLIHHTDYPGAEPAIVFVHGFTCDEADWAYQVKHFGVVGQRIITLDLPGHGKSMSCNTSTLTMKAMGSEVVTMLHHLRVKSTIVVGHSMGTIIATEIATQAPDMVIGVALIDGSRIAKGDPEEAVAKSNARFEQVGFTRCVTDIFEPMFLPGSDEKEKEHIIDRACAQPEYTSIKILSSAIRWCAADFEYKYSQLKVPVQVVQSTHRGEGNKRVPVTSDMHIEWHNELKTFGVDVEFDLVADCGHFAMLDKPEVVNTNIERLLERIEAATAQYSSASAQ